MLKLFKTVCTATLSIRLAYMLSLYNYMLSTRDTITLF